MSPSWFRPRCSCGVPSAASLGPAAAAPVSTYLANSSLVGDRIQRAYGIQARAGLPAGVIDLDAPEEPVLGVEPGFLLTVSRARAYKNAVASARPWRRTRPRLVVVGETPPRAGGGVWSDRLQVRRAHVRRARCAGSTATPARSSG